MMMMVVLVVVVVVVVVLLEKEKNDFVYDPFPQNEAKKWHLGYIFQNVNKPLVLSIHILS